VIKRTYEDDVDYFGVHCRHTNGVYLIPIADIPLRRCAALRVEPTKNNQSLRVRWARDYEIGTVAIGGLRAPSGA
jgi:hypothetical protein